jgi:hypothetical protein
MVHFGKAQPLVFLRQTDEYRLAASNQHQVPPEPPKRLRVANCHFSAVTAQRRTLVECVLIITADESCHPKKLR